MGASTNSAVTISSIDGHLVLKAGSIGSKFPMSKNLHPQAKANQGHGLAMRGLRSKTSVAPGDRSK